MSNSERIKGTNYECFSLDWDINYFGVTSARVNLIGKVDEEGQGRIKDFCNRYDFVTISNVNNNKYNNHWIGTKTNAYLVDMNIQFIKIIRNKPSNYDDKTYVVNNLPRNKQIVDIAKKSFQYSRFFNDPKLPVEKAKNIYLYWTECAFNQEEKYFVVKEIKGQIAGYILFSVSEKESIIELIAVDEKYQGQGVGKSLIQTMESYVLDNRINKIKVGTQVDNISAANFYVKMSFSYVSCTSVYHLWRRK